MPTLYRSEDPQRFFLIPEETSLPKGKLAMRSLTGERREVDEIVAAAFEISEEEAKDHARGVVNDMARRTKAVLSGAGQVLREVARAQRAGDVLRKTPNPTEHNVADALGITTDQLRGDPEAVKKGLMGVFDGLRVTLEKLAKEPGDEEGRKAIFQALDAAVVANGGEPLPADVQEWPERLRSFLADGARLDELKAATEALRDAARRGDKKDA
jgi:hypothetical protein